MKILKHIFILIICLIAFTILLCCSNAKQEANINLSENQNTRLSNSNTNQFNVAEFERNKELWTSKNIQNYKMIVGASGFIMNLPEEVLVDVKNHQAKSIKSLSKKGKNYTEGYKNYSTVEKIFDFIDKGKGAYKLEVTFDENTGYPKQVIYDGSSNIADDELSLEIKTLEIEN